MSNPCLVDDAGLRAALEHGFRLAEQLDWRSHDPYDLLLSPYARPLGTSSFAARAWIQVGKRTGGGVRRILRVPLHREAKALADFLRAAVVLDCLGETAYRLTAGRLEQMLGELRCTTRAGCGWGLSFPYVSRFGPIAMGSPNVYTTTNVCQALLDAEGESGEIPELVAAARRFLIEDLGRFSFGRCLWFRYAPGGTAPIVNVQASAASLFARLGWASADEDSKPFAHEAAATAVRAQRPDGSWPYSVDGSGEFVDGFHTGFTLEGLAGYRALAGADSVAGTEEALAKGLSYFESHLITPTDIPREYANGAPTTDAQTVAQCVQTLALCGGAGGLERALRIWRGSVSRHLDPRPEELLSLRWTLGPAVLATAHVLDRSRDESAR